MPQVVSYYPAIESENKKGKKIVEYPNRYFVMRNNNDVKVNEDVCTCVHSYNWLQLNGVKFVRSNNNL